MKKQPATLFLSILLSLLVFYGNAQTKRDGSSPALPVLVPVAPGWSNNSVNVTVFRKNSLATHGDTQFIAFYDPEGYLTLGKRHPEEREWTLNRTSYRGNTNDAHNIISIMPDGEGYLHVSWDHHGHPLRYAVTTEPYSLELGEERPMTGELENNVTYPEFFRMPDGGLVFMYRDGGSGRGNLVMKRYDASTRTWTMLQQNLISGENRRNAYWQACVDDRGTIHVSWVWRETPDVATNHDLCYARSKDGGISWENSKGEKYTLPITAATAETAVAIPQGSELINQTSMTTDSRGNPYIATYWRQTGTDIPQFHVVRHDGKTWHDSDLGFRTEPFSLGGVGTKRIPISRPQVVADLSGGRLKLMLIFRDEERGEKVSVAVCDDVSSNRWTISDLTGFPVGSWEPTFDTELWRSRGKLHLFVQRVEQVDGEGRADIEPQMIHVLEVE